MNRIGKVGFIIIGLLIAIRLVLPAILLNVVNKELANMDGYSGKMKDLDLHLYRGAYQFEGIEIEKIDAKVKKPFVKINEVDISIDWDAIFKGKFVGDVTLFKPELNFAIDSTAEVTQTGMEHDWLATIKNLVPFEANLNTFQVNEGILVYSDYSEKPFVEEAISNIQIEANNLSNAIELSNPLPSKFRMKGKSGKDGQLDITADINILKKIPDFDLNIELIELDLTELNDFTEAYSNFDFQNGKFYFYSELAMQNGEYNGYLKPVFESVKIFDKASEKKEKFTRKMWEKTVSIGAEIFENQSKDRLAAKVPISGTLVEDNINGWATLRSVFKNAFIKAIPKNIEETISIF